jgi:hypothetical protein
MPPIVVTSAGLEPARPYGQRILVPYFGPIPKGKPLNSLSYRFHACVQSLGYHEISAPPCAVAAHARMVSENRLRDEPSR